MNHRWVGTDQDSLNPAKDGSIRAYTQGQAENGQKRETRTAPEYPEAEAEVLPRRLDHRQAPLVAAHFLGLLDAAEADEGFATRVSSRHALSHIEFDGHL